MRHGSGLKPPSLLFFKLHVRQKLGKVWSVAICALLMSCFTYDVPNSVVAWYNLRMKGDALRWCRWNDRVNGIGEGKGERGWSGRGLQRTFHGDIHSLTPSFVQY